MKEKQSQMKIFPTPGGGARVAFHPQGQPETTNQWKFPAADIKSCNI